MQLDEAEVRLPAGPHALGAQDRLAAGAQFLPAIEAGTITRYLYHVGAQ